LFLLPSESESFGLVALEAMSFGIPVITTNSGGITELVKNSETGYACNVGDVVNMSRVSIDLLSDSDLYSEFSVNAYRRAKMYDINEVIPLYEECYVRVLNS